jgi:hypothetical protein
VPPSKRSTALSKHATQTAISTAVQKIIAIACKAQKPISIEYLDFTKKKAQLSYASPGRQRMLSAFSYTRFAQAVGARAHDAGIEVVEGRRVQFQNRCSEIRSTLRLERPSRDDLRARPARTKVSRSLEAQQQKARLKATSGRGKARLETYARPLDRAILAAPRRRKRPETEASDVPRCNPAGVISTPGTRSGVGGCS